jgi:hypothetical protein
MLPRAVLLAICGVVAACLVVSTGAPGAPAAFALCTGKQVRSLVTQHIAAFNAGNLSKLDRLWERDRFQWYSTQAPGERFNDEARRRSTLLRYFADRHAHHERLRLRSFRFNGNSNGYGHFEYRLWRSADELTAHVAVLGKGAATCGPPSTGRIAVWSMGLE